MNRDRSMDERKRLSLTKAFYLQEMQIWLQFWSNARNCNNPVGRGLHYLNRYSWCRSDHPFGNRWHEADEYNDDTMVEETCRRISCEFSACLTRRAPLSGKPLRPFECVYQSLRVRCRLRQLSQLFPAREKTTGEKLQEADGGVGQETAASSTLDRAAV